MRVAKRIWLAGVCIMCSWTVAVFGQSLAPFGQDASVRGGTLRTAKAMTQPVDCFSEANRPQWMVELPPAPEGATITQGFELAQVDGQAALVIHTNGLTSRRSTVRVLLDGGAAGNGDQWYRAHADYVSFLCRSNKPASMTFHLLQRGKSAGTYQAAFTAKPGPWQRVILPIDQFGLRNFARVAGIGFRSADVELGTDVSIRDITVGTMPYSDSVFASRRLSISLKGDWHFATDPGEQGMKDRWFADDFDASSWKTLASGKSWQEQGVDHHGWGWYRQQIFVPAECKGTPLTLTLTKIASDDDAWFNGHRIGGWSSEYKYNNFLLRTYTVPASLIRYGQTNTIAIRIWGGNLSFIGDKSGLVAGPLTAELDPFGVYFRQPAPGSSDIPYDLFDLSDAQRGQPFEIVIRLPVELAQDGAKLHCRITDFLGNEILSTDAAPTTDDQIARAVVPIDGPTSQTIYLRGRLKIALTVEGQDGQPLYASTRELDRLSFAKRDVTPLPALAETFEDTPYGKLKLIDDIDCAQSLGAESHPYMQSGFDHAQDRVTPGAPLDMQVHEILGKMARECEHGWFAYRVGRGKLKPHTTYLLRIEYPEDKPRFAPVEIQTGQNYTDDGWKNGVGVNDPYDNWPLSGKWQWYDVIVPLDDQTVGTGGTGTAPAENGFWVYFMNKVSAERYYAMYSGGPAVARIKLYEIDPEKNAPVISTPKDLPHRVLMFDWERQPDHDPTDLVRYAKLMGYNAISPVILKWFFANYSEPLNGYSTVVIDAHDYWVTKHYDPDSGQPAASPIPGTPSQHNRYLAATKQYGIDYIPRIEWGGSQDLPKSAWAIDVNGQPTKPNRFAPWCANLLNPLTFDDLKKLMDHLIKPYVDDNPQLTGALWRIRCQRMPPSYGPDDIQLFCRETGIPLPPGGEAQWAAWASGEAKARYDDWWHKKRAEFDQRLVELMHSYRSDLTVYYYNWDPDKFGLIEPDITAWAFVRNVVKLAPDGGRAAYEAERKVRATYTAEDYISVLRTGNFGKAFGGLNRADLGIRPDLYRNIPGFEIFAPVSYLCYADKPAYLNYFQTADGLAVSNCVSYDEIGARTINPKYEGNMITPAGAPFSMALELLSYFHGDARTLTYTVYTYGRGFADAHRRFAQAFLALPAIPGQVVDQPDADLKLRLYPSANGTYLGAAFKGYSAKSLTIKIPADSAAKITDLVTGQPVSARFADGQLQFELNAEPMSLNAYLIR